MSNNTICYRRILYAHVTVGSLTTGPCVTHKHVGLHV